MARRWTNDGRGCRRWCRLEICWPAPIRSSPSSGWCYSFRVCKIPLLLILKKRAHCRWIDGWRTSVLFDGPKGTNAPWRVPSPVLYWPGRPPTHTRKRRAPPPLDTCSTANQPWLAPLSSLPSSERILCKSLFWFWRGRTHQHFKIESDFDWPRCVCQFLII